MPTNIWAGGTGYVGANQQFVNSQLVFYLSGNWQVAQFNEAVGNKFEWKAVLNGYNTQAGGLPGGKFLIAFKGNAPRDNLVASAVHSAYVAAMNRIEHGWDPNQAEQRDRHRGFLLRVALLDAEGLTLRAISVSARVAGASSRTANEHPK